MNWKINVSVFCLLLLSTSIFAENKSDTLKEYDEVVNKCIELSHDYSNLVDNYGLGKCTMMDLSDKEKEINQYIAKADRLNGECSAELVNNGTSEKYANTESEYKERILTAGEKLKSYFTPNEENFIRFLDVANNSAIRLTFQWQSFKNKEKTLEEINQTAYQAFEFYKVASTAFASRTEWQLSLDKIPEYEIKLNEILKMLNDFEAEYNKL